MGPTALFPVRLRRPAAIVVCASELGLGAGLLVTAGRFGAGPPALAVRSLTVVLFWVCMTLRPPAARFRRSRGSGGLSCRRLPLLKILWFSRRL